MNELEKLPNIGPQLAGALRDAGIEDAAALRRIGSVEAWWSVHPHFPCLHSLLALEGAIQGVPKRELDDSTRHRLQEAARS